MNPNDWALLVGAALSIGLNVALVWGRDKLVSSNEILKARVRSYEIEEYERKFFDKKPSAKLFDISKLRKP